VTHRRRARDSVQFVGRGSFARVLLALAALLLVGLVGSVAGYGQRPRALHIRILSRIDPGVLASSGALVLNLRSSAGGRVRVMATLAGEAPAPVAGAGPRVVRLRAHRTRRVALALGAAFRQALVACRPGRIVISVAPVRGAPVRARQVTIDVASQPARCGGFFAADSVWNRRLPADAPLDPNSPAITTELLRQVDGGYRSGHPPTINSSAYSTPVYTVGGDQPRIRVALDQPSSLAPDLQAAFSAVPIPDGARPATGTDSQLVVWQPATDTMWEFWQLARRADGWHARWGGRIEHVSTDPGHFGPPHGSWGATATGLPLVGGLMLVGELQRGTIDHALALAVPFTRADVFAWPAQRTDGNTPAASAIPEGAHFRLDPTVNVDGLGLPPAVRAIAVAAQRYGLIVRDRSADVALYAEDLRGSVVDPYAALLGGSGAQDLLRQFPWDRLQLVKSDLQGTPAGTPACGLPLLCPS
jgi:hypothetical protein